VLTFANLAARVEGLNLKLEKFAFHAEERGLGRNLGVVWRGRNMLDVDRYSYRKLQNELAMSSSSARYVASEVLPIFSMAVSVSSLESFGKSRPLLSGDPHKVKTGTQKFYSIR